MLLYHKHRRGRHRRTGALDVKIAMDGIGILGLASNVAQFLEYGIKGIRLFAELMSDADGASKYNSEIQQIVTHIAASMRDVKKTSTDETLLGGLLERSLTLSQEILEILKGLKMKDVKGKLRIVEGLYKAGKSMYRKEELEQLARRLLDLRAEISSHMIILIE